MMMAVDDEMGDGMQCHDHPFKNTTPGGGICAICLQEKLGKLVSSSSSSFFGTSTSPSFRSDSLGCGSTTSNRDAATHSLSLSVAAGASSSSTNRQESGRKARIPFLLIAHKKKKKNNHYSSSSSSTELKRSKSTATPSRRRGGNPFLPSEEVEDYNSPHNLINRFWSFLYPSKPSKSEKEKTSSSSSSRDLRMADTVAAVASSTTTTTTTVPSAVVQSLSKKQNASFSAASASISVAAAPPPPLPPLTTPVATTTISEAVVVVDESADSPNSSTTSFGRKVSRSRSVGCGSRSFSGDFFERISTGFGDCTLRRVESQREGRRSSSVRRSSTGDAMIKERVRCGGIFSTFMMENGHNNHNNGKGLKLASSSASTPLVHGRSRSWGWAFASPIRAFTMKDGSRHSNNRSNNNGNGNGNRTPNLAAIPSLLTVRS